MGCRAQMGCRAIEMSRKWNIAQMEYSAKKSRANDVNPYFSNISFYLKF